MLLCKKCGQKCFDENICNDCLNELMLEEYLERIGCNEVVYDGVSFW
jgi:uncharacterized membrane protein YvbJ